MIFTAFLLFVFIVSLVSLFAFLDTNGGIVTVRGSYCYRALGSVSVSVYLVHGVLVVSLIAISYIAVVLFSILMVKYIKEHTINSKKVVRDVY